jgi:anti-anti-sigma factor
MQIQPSSQDGMTVLTLARRLDLAAAPQLQRAILKHLAQHPPAIVCDLAQVEVMDPLCAGVFTSIRHPALGWPNTTMVLCAPTAGGRHSPPPRGGRAGGEPSQPGGGADQRPAAVAGRAAAAGAGADRGPGWPELRAGGVWPLGAWGWPSRPRWRPAG